MLAENSEIIQETASHLRELSEDEKIQIQCEAREMYYMDISCAREEGWEKGHEEGQANGIALAKKIFHLEREGLSHEQIATQCSLSVEDVENILE